MLKTLLSLRMNTYFLSFNYFRTKSVLPYDIFRIVAKDMTAVQNYLSVNCSTMSSNNISIYLGYWIDINIPRAVGEYKPLRQTLHFVILKSCKKLRCSPTQTILKHFMSDEVILNYLENTSVLVNNGVQMIDKRILIKDLYHRMTTSYDIETVFWFQDSLIASIMKVLSVKY